MALPEFYQPELEAHKIPAHAEAAIGPAALRYRAEILDDLIPKVFDALKVFDCSLRLCFYDLECRERAQTELGSLLIELGQKTHLMGQSAFTLGEA